MDHAPGSLSKYMTTIYSYFCIKMIFLDFLKVKYLQKYAPKRTKLHHSKIFFGEACPEPPSKRIATPPVKSPPPKKKIVRLPWQILHTPMNYY